MNIQDLVLIDGVRTPMAEFNGPFADLSAIELGARAAKALFERIGAVRQRMLADWAAEGPSYGVDKPMEMLEFFEQRYKSHAGK